MPRNAFLISAYTDPQHLGRFVRQLPADADIYVHVDANVDIRPFRQATEGTGTMFIDDRKHVAWGSFAQVEYQIGLLRAALAHRPDYAHLFILSGQDYPVWGLAHMERYLDEHRGQNLIQAICMDGQPSAATRPYRCYQWLGSHSWRPGSLGSKLRVALRRIGNLFLHKRLTFRAGGQTFRLYKGSDYFALTADTAAYVLHQWDRLPQLQRYFRTGFAPSETCIHTILFNSPLAARCLLSQGRYKSLAALTPLTYIDYNPVIKVLTTDDYEAVIRSGKMFCRKVVSGTSDELAERLDLHRREEDLLMQQTAGRTQPSQEPETEHRTKII